MIYFLCSTTLFLCIILQLNIQCLVMHLKKGVQNSKQVSELEVVIY